ncbi:MAG: hypothetical protein WC732_05395 [Candidatus Omnitrophota bacterium]
MLKKALIVLCALLLVGCATASDHRQLVQDDKGDRLTVGTVQRKIKVGMPSSAVIEALGSPNIVTTDEERQEVWIYDKIATDVTYSSSEADGGVFLLISGFSGTGRSGSSSSSQRTLTVIVKFDKENKVRDFAYHTSSF